MFGAEGTVRFVKVAIVFELLGGKHLWMILYDISLLLAKQIFFLPIIIIKFFQSQATLSKYSSLDIDIVRIKRELYKMTSGGHDFYFLFLLRWILFWRSTTTVQPEETFLSLTSFPPFGQNGTTLSLCSVSLHVSSLKLILHPAGRNYQSLRMWG